MEKKTKEEILSKISPQKQKYLAGRASGKSKYKSAIAAGYTHATARNPRQIETPDLKQAFQELMRLSIPASHLVKRIKEGTNATKTTFFQVNGVVTDSKESVDYRERREAVLLASQMAGYYTPKHEQVETRRIDPETAKCIAEVANMLQISELPWETRRELRKSLVIEESTGVNSLDNSADVTSESVEASE